jgi:hypothetical protein
MLRGAHWDTGLRVTCTIYSHVRCLRERIAFCESWLDFSVFGVRNQVALADLPTVDAGTCSGPLQVVGHDGRMKQVF